jgi:DNA replication protein DnaC
MRGIGEILGAALAVPDKTPEEWAQWDADIAAAREAAAVEDEKNAAQMRIERMLASGFPRRAVDAAQAAKRTRAIEHMQAWGESGETIAVLSGNPGSGKTVAACEYVIRTKRSEAMFVRAGEYSASSHYGDDRKRWLAATVLVCDDIGAERGDCDWDLLIDKFYGDKRRLILTTNLRADDFKKRYGERVVDRIRECGKWYVCTGESMRVAPSAGGGK